LTLGPLSQNADLRIGDPEGHFIRPKSRVAPRWSRRFAVALVSVFPRSLTVSLSPIPSEKIKGVLVDSKVDAF
jgi:hypothetical protein